MVDALPGRIADQIDFDQRVLDQKPGGTDRRARRWRLEVIAPDLVEGIEVVEVRQEDLSLDDIDPASVPAALNVFFKFFRM